MRLGPSLDAIIERHGYPLAVARPLAEAMVLCAALATSLKYDGIFTLQISGDGPIRLLVTDLTSDGALRGYAQFDSWKLAVALGAGNHDAPDGYVPKLFGQGRLTFTVDQGQHTERYQGVVPLEGADPGRLRPHLFPPVRAAADRHQDRGPPRRDDGTAIAGAPPSLMVQQMPEFDAGRIDVDQDQREDDWRKAVILMASATEKEMLDPALPGTTLLFRLFHAEGARLFERRAFQARCRCSRERIDGVLKSIRREELADLRDPHGPGRRQLRVLLDRVRLRRQRTSTGSTPPRSRFPGSRSADRRAQLLKSGPTRHTNIRLSSRLEASKSNLSARSAGPPETSVCWARSMRCPNDGRPDSNPLCRPLASACPLRSLEAASFSASPTAVGEAGVFFCLSAGQDRRRRPCAWSTDPRAAAGRSLPE